MRGSVLAILFSVMCSSASAEETSKPSPLASDDIWVRQSACKGVGDIAVTIMKQRQQDVPMSEMIKRLQMAEAMGINEGTGITTNVAVSIVTAAYKYPAFSNPERQKEAIASFRNEIELPCFEGKFATAP